MKAKERKLENHIKEVTGIEGQSFFSHQRK
jgi:hypothetical protein